MRDNKQTTPDLESMMRRQVTDADLPSASTAGPARQSHDAGQVSGPVEQQAGKPAPHTETPAPAETRDDQAVAEEQDQEQEQGPKPKPVEAPGPKPDYRFKSWDEAERGYKEIQSRVTKEEQRRAELRKELEGMQEKIAAMETADLERRNREKMVSDISDYSEKRHAELMQDLSGIDPEDPKHTERAARLWAQYHRDLKKFELEWKGEAPEPKPVVVKEHDQEQEQEQGGQDVGQVSRPAETPAPAAPIIDDQAQIAELRSLVNGIVRQAGIDPDDPVYSHYAARVQVVTEDGAPIPLGDQVNAAIEATKKYKADEIARLKQGLTQPMGRGGPGRAAPAGADEPKNARPMSMQDAIDKAMEARRL